MKTRTTAIDNDDEPDLTVIILSHAYDFNDLAGPVEKRIITALGRDPTGCHYFNPAATVSCRQPTQSFYASVRREVAKWCRIASKTIKKRNRRTVKAWVSHERIQNKYARFLDRAVCFTGVLFIQERMVSLKCLKDISPAGPEDSARSNKNAD